MPRTSLFPILHYKQFIDNKLTVKVYVSDSGHISVEFHPNCYETASVISALSTPLEHDYYAHPLVLKISHGIVYIDTTITDRRPIVEALRRLSTGENRIISPDFAQKIADNFPNEHGVTDPLLFTDANFYQPAPAA